MRCVANFTFVDSLADRPEPPTYWFVSEQGGLAKKEFWCCDFACVLRWELWWIACLILAMIAWELWCIFLDLCYGYWSIRIDSTNRFMRPKLNSFSFTPWSVENSPICCDFLPFAKGRCVWGCNHAVSLRNKRSSQHDWLSQIILRKTRNSHWFNCRSPSFAVAEISCEYLDQWICLVNKDAKWYVQPTPNTQPNPTILWTEITKPEPSIYTLAFARFSLPRSNLHSPLLLQVLMHLERLE